MAERKVVVRRGYAGAEMGVLLHEGPKILKVERIYHASLDVALKTTATHGENWPKSMCFVLDPVTDAATIAKVQDVIQTEREFQKQLSMMQDEHRKQQKTAMDAIFPAEKADGICPVCGAVCGCRYQSGGYVVPTHFTPTTGTRCAGAGMVPVKVYGRRD